jgi:hypothetical protein
MRYAAVLAMMLAVSGCSRGLDGFYQEMHFDSAPTGAAVNVAVVDGKERLPVRVDGSCFTPCTLPIARDRSYVATFAKAGCTPSEARIIPTRMEPFFAPLLPDEISGNPYDLTPDPIRAQLACGTGA